MKRINILTACLLGLSTMALTSCGDVADEVTSIVYGRNFSPVGFEAKSITENSATLQWTAVSGATGYDLEIFADDSLTFEGSPTVTYSDISADYVKYVVEGLMYDTKYSARVRALDSSDESRNSKWSTVFFQTSAQQILNSIKTTRDVGDRNVHLSWDAAEHDLTTVIIRNENGEIVVSYTLNDEDRAAGEVTLAGLSPETTYTAKLYNNGKERGSRKFTTIADLNGAITVRPSEDLKDIIANAEDGAVLALYGGTYNIQNDNEEITAAMVKKNLTIKGIYSDDVPVIKGRFQIDGGVSLELNQVVLDGSENNSDDQAFNFKSTADVPSLIVKNSEIKGFVKGVFYANTQITIGQILFDGCTIHDIVCDGGDLFDSRTAYIKDLKLNDCTIYNCAQSRDFIRMDNASSKFSGAAPVITVNHCTINNVCNETANKRLLYVRFKGNVITWTNNLLTNTKAVYSNQSSTSMPTFSNNAYFGCSDNLLTKVEVDGKVTYPVYDEGGQKVDDPK